MGSIMLISGCLKQEEIAVENTESRVFVDHQVQQYILGVINAKATMHANFSGRSSVLLNSDWFATPVAYDVFRLMSAESAANHDWQNNYTMESLQFVSIQETATLSVIAVKIPLHDGSTIQEWFTIDRTSNKLIGYKSEMPVEKGPIEWFLVVFDEKFSQRLQDEPFTREVYRYYLGERDNYPSEGTGSSLSEGLSVEDRASYNRNNASTYAYTWWNGNNSAYRTFNADCTNFVSQCIKAGGFVNNSAWYYNNYWSWSTKWTVANDFRTWLSSYSNTINAYTKVYSLSWFSTSSGLKKGDVLAWDFDENGTTDHVMIVGAIVCRYKNGVQIEDAEVLGHTNAVKKYFKDYSVVDVFGKTSFNKIVSTN